MGLFLVFLKSIRQDRFYSFQLVSASISSRASLKKLALPLEHLTRYQNQQFTPLAEENEHPGGPRPFHKVSLLVWWLQMHVLRERSHMALLNKQLFLC